MAAHGAGTVSLSRAAKSHDEHRYGAARPSSPWSRTARSSPRGLRGRRSLIAYATRASSPASRNGAPPRRPRPASPSSGQADHQDEVRRIAEPRSRRFSISSSRRTATWRPRISSPPPWPHHPRPEIITFSAAWPNTSSAANLGRDESAISAPIHRCGGIPGATWIRRARRGSERLPIFPPVFAAEDVFGHAAREVMISGLG